ncbi:hypothetical protein KCU88_g6397, partial [Aureobasidium melanogenum]
MNTAAERVACRGIFLRHLRQYRFDALYSPLDRGLVHISLLSFSAVTVGRPAFGANADKQVPPGFELFED